MGNELSREGDVYSYEILLLEVFTGKRPTDEMFKDSFNIHNFVKTSLPERLVQIANSTLLVRTTTVEEENYTNNDGNASEIEDDCVEEIAIRNSQNMPDHRPLTATTDVWECLHSVLRIGISCSIETSNERM